MRANRFSNLLLYAALVCAAFNTAFKAFGWIASSKPAGPDKTNENTDWPAYGNDPGGMRYSPLIDINRDNVTRLKVAWQFHADDISDGNGSSPRSGFETTP